MLYINILLLLAQAFPGSSVARLFNHGVATQDTAARVYQLPDK